MARKSALVVRRLPLVAMLWAGLVVAADPAAVRDAEIRECRAGDLATWGDGRDRPAPSRQMFFKTVGDAFCAAFQTADAALAFWKKRYPLAKVID